MDKESNERMAPALHTTGNDSTDAGVITEDSMYEQLNGVLSNHDENDVESIVKIYPFMSNHKKDSTSTTLSYGSGGDNCGLIVNKQGIDSVLGKAMPSRNQLHKPSGDADVIKKIIPTKENSSAQSLVIINPLLNIDASATMKSDECISKSTTTLTSTKSNTEKKANAYKTALSNNTSNISTSELLIDSCEKFLNSSALVVNVDKHNSINPQIMHTTSITTSSIDIAHSPDSDQNCIVNFDFQNLIHLPKNKDIKTLKGNTFDNDETPLQNVEKETTISVSNSITEDVQINITSEASQLESKADENFICSSTISLKMGEADKLCLNYANGAVVSSAVEDRLPINSVSLNLSLMANSIASVSSNNGACNYNNLNLTTNVVRALSKTKTSVLSSSTIDITSNYSNIFETSCSFSTSLPSITQSTAVDNSKQSIPTYCFHRPLMSTTDAIASPLKVKNTVSLHNVPKLKDLAHGFVTKALMQELSPKVTNTLQDLAASLCKQGTGDVSSYSKVINTLNCVQTTLQQANNVDKNVNSKVDLYNIDHVANKLKEQYLEVLRCNDELKNKISLLESRLNNLRANVIAQHTRKNLPFWKLSSSSSLSKSFTKNLPFNSKPNGNIHESEEQSKEMSHPQNLEKKINKMSDLNSSSLGILKKEIITARKRIDPDFTDSGSEDEFEESIKSNNSVYSSGFSPSGVPIQKTALWNWARNRASVAHRWTWLNAHVTGIEFKIKQHEELQRQLRTVKDEIVFEHPTAVAPHPACHEQEPRVPDTNVSSCPKSDFVTSVWPVLSNDVSHPAEHMSNSRSPAVIESTSCARVRPLKHRLRHRKMIKVSDARSLYGKRQLKPPTIRNDCDIMLADQFQHTPFHRPDGKSRGIVHSSMRSRAAMHDHSYHKILSTDEDIPISLRLNGVLFTNNKQFVAKLRRHERRSDKRHKRKQKEARQREDRLLEKIKSRPRSATVVLERADKLIRSVSALQRNTSFEDRASHFDLKKRRSTTSLSEFKRSRMTSFDSDAESLYNRSESGTPVFDSPSSYSSNPQYQAFLKRKRANDHAYDINNIVIPHGLTSTRIEKLQYKEILTPGWRTKANDVPQKDDANPEEENEDVSDEIFKSRHDRHEILEKKKYMMYLEKNINKRTGARSMSRANLPLDDPPSFFSPSFRASPTNPFPPSDLAAPASPEPCSPSLMLRSRRSSSEQSLHSNASCQPTSDRSKAHDSAPIDDALLRNVHRENSSWEAWEPRTFPLSQQDVDEMARDPVVFIKKLPKELETNQVFQPIAAQGEVGDTHSVPKSKTLSRSDSVAQKRSRNNSHVSRDDERFSDDSISSSRSLHRFRPGANDTVNHTPVSSPAASSMPQRKRHRPSHKDDYYYYPNLELSSTSDSDSDSVRVTAGEKSAKSNVKSEWVSRGSTPKRNTSGDDDGSSPGQKPPLLLKVKKKFLYR